MMRRTLLTTAIVLGITAAGATAVIDLSLATMLDRADVIVYGQVAAIVAEAVDTPDGEEIRTRVTFDVARDLASPNDPREELVLSFLGGRTAAGEVTEVAGVPTFTVGEHVLVLAYDEPGADDEADDVVGSDDPASRLASPVVGVWQGLWRLGPRGLGDERGRLLTPGPDGLAVDGPGGDITAVLDGIAAWLGGESDIQPEPEPEAAAAEAPVAPAADEVADEAAEEAGSAPASAEDSEDGLQITLRPPESDALRRTVDAAAAAWRAAGADVEVTFDDAAADVVTLGDPLMLGPDALALRVRRSGEGGSVVLVHPDAVTRTDVAAFELAALAGATRTETGLLSGRFDATRETPPTAADAAALRADRERIPGDLDGDGDVDVYDLARVAESHGLTGSRLPADLDGSGRVDDADLDLLRERYEFQPPAPEPPAGWTGTPD